MDKDLQFINDEITCNKRSLGEVEDKLEVLNFLKGIDSSLEKSITTNTKELLNKKKSLEENLEILRDKKSKLSKKTEKEDSVLGVASQNPNSLRLRNYLFSVNTVQIAEKEDVQKNL